MLGFSPFKKHANKFNYIPRYYDPAKEAREERRAELLGVRADDDREYAPGQLIRTQHAARAARRARRSDEAQNKVWKMVVGAVIVLLFIYLLYPRLAEVFIKATQQHEAPLKQTEEVYDNGFDPAAPITVVPNDYVEGE